MKKNIIIVIIFGSLIGFLFSKMLFKNYEGKEYYQENGNIYYIQYGVYTSNEAALNNVSDLTNYKIIENDDKYYVYLGITSDYENALKIKKMYEEKDIYSYIRADYVKNSETLDKLKEYDSKLTQLNDNSKIQEVIQEIFQETDLSF